MLFGGLPWQQKVAIIVCITGEQPLNELVALSRGALWKLQVDVDQKL